MKATVAYTHDNHFQLPMKQYPAHEPQPGEQEVPQHGWAELLHTYLYRESDYSFDLDYPVMHNVDHQYPFFVCKEAVPLENHTGHYRVYELTWNVGNLDQVRYKLPLIMDANPEVLPPTSWDPNNPYYRSDIPRFQIAGLEGEAYIDERHYGGANYAYSDGHVERSESLKERLAEDWDLDPETENR
jgi:prepilin-type processing-associated H-X9-DG protein